MSPPERSALVFVHGQFAGRLRRLKRGAYAFTYELDYDGPSVSLTMPVRRSPYTFDRFPPFFDGLLPEGWQLEGLLRYAKLDRDDYMGQLLAVGADMVGAVTVQADPLEERDHGR